MKLCWLYQRALSCTLDSNSGPPELIARHLQGCPECRRYQQRQLGLVNGLIAAASRREEIPSFLHARIVSKLGQVPLQPTAKPRDFLWLRAAAIPALGVLMLLGYVSFQPEKQVPPPARATPAPLAFNQLAGSLDPGTWLVWGEQVDKPLQTELKSVVSDAKVALESLTQNFLPENAVAQVNR